MMLHAGVRLGPYQVVSLIAVGGMGEVYRAHDSRLNRDVAVKVLSTELAKDEPRLQRFEKEARAVSSLSHPNILTLYDIGTHDGLPYMVAELIEGKTVRERLTEGPVPLRKAVDYALQIAAGLAAAHDKGVIHRVLKPQQESSTRAQRNSRGKSGGRAADAAGRAQGMARRGRRDKVRSCSSCGVLRSIATAT